MTVKSTRTIKRAEADGTLVDIDWTDLKVGDKFRMYEPDGTPTHEHLWRALAPGGDYVGAAVVTKGPNGEDTWGVYSEQVIE